MGIIIQFHLKKNLFTMKTFFTFFAVTILAMTLQAKVVYLNNNLEEPNISENLYTNWADAYAAVSDGDTIYVVGSNFSHGNVTIDKPVTVIGPGYFLDENDGTQINKKMALFSRINLVAGSDNSTITGITINVSNYTGVYIADAINDITVENCYIRVVNIDNLDGTVYNNIQIKKCFIWGNGLQSRINNHQGICTNIIFTNNIVTGEIYLPDGSDGIFSNNLFYSNNLYFGASSSLEISNNIYINENSDNFTIQPLPDASVHNNISITGAFGNENDNFSAPQSTLFNTDENATSDGMYMLSENSPAKGAGSNGTDIGPFGGPDPYRLSGLPNLPNIYELSTGGLVAGDELPVRIKIKQ
jgi:hypothetical protein